MELLKGMKVIEIASFMAAPICGRILGEWGADVVKIEPLAGDTIRGVGISRHIYNGDPAGFDAVNACKKYIALDTRQPEGLAVLKSMLKDCDVFITHLRDKDSQKLGLDYETLKEENPKIIFANTSGYGLKGADAGRGGFDGAAYAARAGFTKDCPLKGDSPMVPYFGFGDIPAGTYLAMAVMAAYISQQRTGKGDKINCALMHAGMWSAGFPIVSAAYGDEYPTDPAAVLPLARVYECKDHKFLSLMGLNFQMYWPIFCKATGIAEETAAKWVTYQDALANANEIIALLKDHFMTRDRQEWVDALLKTPMPFDICQDFGDLQKDQQAWDAGFFQGVDYPSGMHIGLVKAPAVFQEAGEAEVTPSGNVGADTRAVLKGYGYTDGQIDDMRARKLLAEGDQWDPDTYNMMKGNKKF